jgi:hypothetical protein
MRAAQMTRQLLGALCALSLFLAPTIAWEANVSTNLSITVTAASSNSSEEFVGPFSNWSNVKTAYGAAGNGTTDDTTSIQNCLNALGSTTQTCWFPAGTYKITAELTLNGKSNVHVIGADPATTTIKWAGSAGGTMLLLNGTNFSRVNRFTFDGSSSAATAINQSSTSASDCCNEYADDVLEDTTSTGYTCGGSGVQCSEVSMLRDTFSSVVNGISLGNGNALDVWCWYCQFTNNSTGVTNNVSGSTSGNANVFNSIFENSTTADLSFGNTGIMTFNNNYSTGSRRFLDSGGGGNPNVIFLDGNTIVSTTNSTSINMSNLGPLVMLDNTIKSTGSSTPAVSVSAGVGGDLFSMGNTFTVGTVGTCSAGSAVQANGHCHSVTGTGGDTVVSAGPLNPNPPTLPGTPPNNARTIFEVTAGSSAATINTAISNAIAAGSRSVVHLQTGSYSIASTITVPASDIQIIGDGDENTHLTWSGGANGTLMQLSSPSKAVLREMLLDGNGGSATCLDVKGADQSGSSVFGQGDILDSSTTANLYIDALDYTNVELHDFQSAGNAASVPNGVLVKGGTSAAGGTWLGGSTNIFSGAGFGATNLLSVTSNGHLSVRQFFNDAGGSASGTIASLSGTGGAISMANIPGFTNTAGQHAVALTNFTGTSAIVNLATFETSSLGDDVISSSGSGANNLRLGMVGISASPFSDTTSPADTHGFLNGSTTNSPPSGQFTGEVTESGTSTNTFLTTALAQLRGTQPVVPTGTATGVTDVRLYRVNTISCIYGVHLEH